MNGAKCTGLRRETENMQNGVWDRSMTRHPRLEYEMI